MAIQEQNIQFVGSEVMDDTTIGGGALTGQVIVDGEMNNIFPDISELDRAAGRFNLRKTAMAIRTNTTDTFYGSVVAITSLPEDPALSYCIAPAANDYDRRPDVSAAIPAANRVYGATTSTAVVTNLDTVINAQSVKIKVAPVVLASVSNVTYYSDNTIGPVISEVSALTPGATIGVTTGSNTDTVVDAVTDGNAVTTTTTATTTDTTITVFDGSVQDTQTLTHPLSTVTVGGESVSAPAQQFGKLITAGNQSQAWSQTLITAMRADSLIVRYWSGGVEKTLADSGGGTLAGDGSGTVNYTTGAVSLTLAAMPDIDTHIIYQWHPDNIVDLSGQNLYVSPQYSLPVGYIVPGSVSLGVYVTTQSASVTYTDSNTGSPDGYLRIGSVIYGEIDYINGIAKIYQTDCPVYHGMVGRLYSVSLSHAAIGSYSATIPPRDINNEITISLPNGNIKPHAVKVSWFVTITASGAEYMHSAFDDGAGVLTLSGTPIGVVDYVAGTITYQPDQPVDGYVTETITDGASVYSYITGNGAGQAATLKALSTITIVSATEYASVVASNYYIYPRIKTGLIGAQGLLFTLLGQYLTTADDLTTWQLPANAPSLLSVINGYSTAYTATPPKSWRNFREPTGGEMLTTIIGADWYSLTTGAAVYPYAASGQAVYDTSGTVTTTRTEITTQTVISTVETTQELTHGGDDIVGIAFASYPADGMVTAFADGDIVIISHKDIVTATPALVGATYQINCGRTALAWVRIKDANGAVISSGYTLDRAAGIVDFGGSISGLATPLTVEHTIADLRAVTQVSGNSISVARSFSRTYPAGSVISSALIFGDRKARLALLFDQSTWDGVTWSDSVTGSAATGTLDTISHPITVTNEGAETERWIVRFLTSTTIQVIGEHRGLVYDGGFTIDDIAPINPRTKNQDGSGGVPYFTIPILANGGGWSAGNVIRFNTAGAIAPFWVARTIAPSDAPAGLPADGVELYAFGNIDQV